MYIVMIQEITKKTIYTTIHTFKRKCIGYWLCILIAKIRGREIIVIEKEKRI